MRGATDKRPLTTTGLSKVYYKVQGWPGARLPCNSQIAHCPDTWGRCRGGAIGLQACSDVTLRAFTGLRSSR